jgi:hypothetical protein
MTTPKHRGQYRPFPRAKAPGRRVLELPKEQCFEIGIEPPESAPVIDSVFDSETTRQDQHP